MRILYLALSMAIMMAGEAMACPYHGLGGPQRYGPFDTAGDWRDARDGFDAPPFERGPTVTQIPDADQSQQKADVKSAPREITERQE